MQVLEILEVSGLDSKKLDDKVVVTDKGKPDVQSIASILDYKLHALVLLKSKGFGHDHSVQTREKGNNGRLREELYFIFKNLSWTLWSPHK